MYNTSVYNRFVEQRQVKDANSVTPVYINNKDIIKLKIIVLVCQKV